MFKIILNSLLGLILIIIWSRFVNLGQIIQALSKVNLIYLIPIFLFMFLSPAIRAVRLKIFLSGVAKIKLLDLVWLNIAAMMLNFFIPIRAGEFAKAVYLNTNFKLPLGKSVIWIFLDRFVDFLAVLVLSAILLFIVPTTLNINIIKIIVMMLSLNVVITYLVIFQVNFTRKIVNFLRPLFILKATAIYFERFSNFILESFSILKRQPKDLGLMFLLTVLGYAADGAIWYFAFIALGFNPGFIKMYLGTLLSALTYLIPAAPGYIGSAEASGVLILSGVFGINSNLAGAMIVLFHILSALFVLVLGLIALFFLKLDLGLILRKALKRG